MKRKLILLCLAAILGSAVVIGGTLAAFRTETGQRGIAQITTKSLSIEIQEEEQKVRLGEHVQPGDTIILSRNIVNDAEEGYALYTRVTINKGWNREGLDSGKIHLYMGDAELITENSGDLAESDWLLWYQDAEQVVLYYRKPLEPWETTSEVLTAVKLDTDADNAYAGANMMLDFDVDAVQKIAAEDAIVSEWGVYPQIDENGYLVSVAE